MSDNADLLDWIESAEVDLESARTLVRKGERFAFPSCFHAQQSAEKYLKALLIFKDAGFPKIHDLVILNKLCEAAGVLVLVEEDALLALSHCAVQTRYPGDPPSWGEAREAISIAKKVRKFARKYLNLK